MKTTNCFLSRLLPFVVCIAGALVLTSFRFNTTVSPRHCQHHNKVVTDTLPDKNININIDMGKIMEEVRVALEKIDFEKIGRDVEASLKKIDWEKINAEINVSIEKIDWDKITKEINESIKKCDPEKQKEIQKELNQMKQKLNSREFKESIQQMKAMSTQEVEKRLNQCKMELETNMLRLQKELKALQAEKLRRDAAMNGPVLKDNILILI